jgi:sulfofructose kinase
MLADLPDTGQDPFDVVGLGYTATDYLAIVPGLPLLNTKLEAHCLSIQGGGPVATALVTVRKLGLKPLYIGKVGDDQFGKFMLSELEREGVDVTKVVCQKGATSQFAFIMVDEAQGHRTIVWTRGTVGKLKRGEADLRPLNTCRCLLLDDLETEAGIEAAARVRKLGVPAVLDAGSLRPGMDELVPLCDYVVGSSQFGEEFTGQKDPLSAARFIFEKTGRVAVITAGEKGSFGVSAEGGFERKAFEVRAVDTTGAGDVFHGAFAFGVLRGWELPRMLEFSNAVAAMKCRKLGGRPGIPTLGEALEFLKLHSPGSWG